MINELISAVLQVVAFSLIPFIVYLAYMRKAKGFLEWIGLKSSNSRANLFGFLSSLIFISSAIGLIFFSEEIRTMLISPETVAGKYREMGISVNTVTLILITALIKTSLSEEIFFRGFLAKRLIAWLGFTTGNIAQAFIFGLLHILLFLSMDVGMIFLAFIFLISGLGAYISCWLNEKLANGSIIPGWIAHGAGNAISYSLIAFVL